MTTTPADPPLPGIPTVDGHDIMFRCRYEIPGRFNQTRPATMVDLGKLIAALPDETRSKLLHDYLMAARKSERTAWSGALHNAMPSGFVEVETDKIIGRVAALVVETKTERDALAAKLDAIENLAADAFGDDFEHTTDAYTKQLLAVLETCANRCPQCPKYLNKCPYCGRNKDGRRLETAGKEGK